MTEHQNDGCILCAVRALTEGTPKTWDLTAEKPVSGVVLAIGTTPSRFPAFGSDGMDLYVDLWLGGTERIRVVAIGATLNRAITDASPQIGDRLTVTFDGMGYIERGKHAGREFRKYSARVERGHH